MPYFERQNLLIGEDGKEILKNASILVAGVGGLGTNAGMLLARAGVGTLHLVDNGILDAPDLNRQILYHKNDIGRKKVEIAKERLDTLGLGTKIFAEHTLIDDNYSLPPDIDGVVDCMDNFEARYILDDRVHQYAKKIFFVHGGIHSLHGQLTSIIPGKTQSLHQLFGGQSSQQDTPIPVIGAVPSIIASLQVVETIKLLLNMDNNLINRLLVMDLNDYSFRTIELS